MRDTFVWNIQNDHRELMGTDLHAPIEIPRLVQMSINGRLAPSRNAAA